MIYEYSFVPSSIYAIYKRTPECQPIIVMAVTHAPAACSLSRYAGLQSTSDDASTDSTS